MTLLSKRRTERRVLLAESGGRTSWSGWKGILTLLFLVALALAFLFPIFWSFISSLKTSAEAAQSPSTYLPSEISVDNFVSLDAKSSGLLTHVSNSLYVAAITVFGTLILSVLAGYGFARYRFPYKKAIFLVILGTMMIPYQTLVVPMFVLLTKIGLDNTLTGLALIHITFQLPFGVFVMRNTFEGIPRQLDEAASVDGCSELGVIRKILLRLAAPGMVTVALYAFINSWNEFFASLILINTESRFTLPVMLVKVQQSSGGNLGIIDWGAVQAGVTVAMIPAILLFLLLQRYYMQGLIAGSVKS